ncbi:nitric oxide reductase activation protein NorD [Rhodoferax ferrireducens]|uniref:nitric oxide reductase activation protein NorD n=1 Tax=Rhodoferax ferrireducens TaxID=192843 RepID=UPI000E0D91A2|nr:VWA domain-containing protein [Rhodoferax ferrireducens]
MEEMVGRWWHKAVTHLAQRDNSESVVHLKDVQKSIGVLFRAAGGSAALRLAPASRQRIGGPRTWLQKVAGSGVRADTAQLEPDVLALPASLSVFDNRTLNRDLYLWLAIQSASFEHTGNWVSDNCQASRQGLRNFPGFASRYQQLLSAHLSLRIHPSLLRGTSALAETTLQAALRGDEAIACELKSSDVAPVWLWLGASDILACITTRSAGANDPTDAARPNAAEDKQRRRTQRTQEGQERNAMVLPFRGEALMSWNEMVRVNRSTDDEGDGNAVAAANDMDKLSLAPDGQTLASRVKFDLDLPSTSADDLPLGPGLRLPEWDYRRGILQPDHCVVQVMEARAGSSFSPSPALRLTARRVSRRLETLRDAPRPLHGQDSGDSIDMDAWIRFSADQMGQGGLHSDTPPVYTRHTRRERSLATLLLADLSLSTDAYATSQAKIIDVIRDALFVFGEALNAVGDPFAMWGFSSVRRHHVRLQHLKSFDETWNASTRARVGAVKPGYYTRMGAAIRHATLQLTKRPERRRLLMLLTDGKPNDLDIYEGRYGIEDTRHAIHEAHAAGLSPFCVTIDESGHDYLPLLFGQQGYALVHRPEDLVNRLTQAWATLARQ